MNKILLIIKREFISRVKKRSFFVMAVLGPLMLTLVFAVPKYIEELERNKLNNIGVIDDSFLMAQTLKSTPKIKYHHLPNMTIDQAREAFADMGVDGVLYIPKNLLGAYSVRIYSDQRIDYSVKLDVKQQLEKDISGLILVKNKLPVDALLASRKKVSVVDVKWEKTEDFIDTARTERAMLAAMGSMLIFIFIFLYSSMVMAGVVEEKKNRIVEIIVSSVKPIQLMFGKIFGIGLVGLFQFTLWCIVSFIMINTAQHLFFSDPLVAAQNDPAQMLDAATAGQIQNVDAEKIEYAVDILRSLGQINWFVVIFSFIFFFLFGYFLYAAMFASMASLIDNDTETGQFRIVVTLPLAISVILVQYVIANPDSSLAVWLSIIPFTSPVAMMARIPFGVPVIQLLFSMLLLLITFWGATAVSGRIYKTAILLYGKKIRLGEILRWVMHK